MRTKLIVALINIIGTLVVSSCAFAVRYDGPYKGRVIDADTAKPIEGMVVLGVWSTETPTAGGAVHRFYDAMETVTDNNGEFEIKGLGLLVVSNVIPMDVLIFKAGYEYFDSPWEALKKSRYLIQKKNIKWEGNKVIIPLKKLTMEERKKQGTPDFYIGERYDRKENINHSCLPKNIKLLPREVNKELLEQGRKPYDLEEGQCDK